MKEMKESAKESGSSTQIQVYALTEAVGDDRKDFGFLPIPTRLRYDGSKPVHYGILLHLTFLFTATFTVANLYYSQPLLIQLADAFSVTDKEVARIPTLMQAGYAAGLIFITPLGDILRRRQLILLLMTISASLTIGLAVTKNVIVFEAISFLIGLATVTPQILLPLAADLAVPERRARAISVVLSGLLFGILVARALSGIIAQFNSWRVVYYFAIGIQYAVIIGCYFMLPDFPPKNQGLSYFDILFSMAKFLVTEPVLIQVCLICIGMMASYSGFWTTLTFLLGDAPYHYSTAVIGLFGLIGIAGVLLAPVFGIFVEHIIPWYSSLISIVFLTLFQAILVGAAGINVAAVVISTVGLDIFRQLLQVSLTMINLSVAPEARARFNALALFAVYIGQVIGTSAGSTIFLAHGWRAGAAFLLGLYGFQLLILLLRGPHCDRYTWFGYEGGFKMFKTPPKGEVVVLPKTTSEADSSAAEEGRSDKSQAGHGDPL